MRAMLDELMGKERNVPLTQRSAKTIRWDDSSVCKYQLCGVCPSKLFKNTKSDRGKRRSEAALFLSGEQPQTHRDLAWTDRLWHHRVCRALRVRDPR